MNSPTFAVIRLSLRNLSQLFNSLDSSPFADRDLDAEAEEFIVSSARELPPTEEMELVIALPLSASLADTATVQDTIRRYFASRAGLKRSEFQQLMRRGRLSLGVAVLFLSICLLLGELVGGVRFGAAGEIAREGLTIVGWVAMWRPLEICLYDWWPIYEERKLLERLATLRVRIIAAEGVSPAFADHVDGRPGTFTASAA